MGYELHIIRKVDWENDEEPSNMTLDEWREYVNADPELEFDQSAVAGEYGEGLCEWNAHPTEKRPRYRPWFAFYKGAIDAKNPDEPTVRKMLQIADRLKAKVQGDDFEFYDEEMIAEVFSPVLPKQKQVTTSKPWWRFW